MRFVALGDSYTIGTAVPTAERWPDQLVARLSELPDADRRPALEVVANLAVNGYTTRDVIAAELPVFARLEPEYASILVGTNDVIQGIDEAEYRANLRRIRDAMVARVGAARVVGVTTPDYTVTAAGADYGDPAARAEQIRRYNEVFREVLEDREIAVIDIHDISLRAREDPSLVADDGLHPSGRQYGLWVERILPVVTRRLEESAPG